MHFVSLRIDCDAKDGWTTFHQAGETISGAFQPRPGFGLAEVTAAAIATGHVQASSAGMMIDAHFGSRRLADAVAEVLAYFDGPGRPSDELLDIRRAVLELADEDASDLRLEAIAWLDLSIREEAADAARSLRNVWSADAATVDLAAIRRRQLAQCLARRTPHSLPVGTLPTERKMAPSVQGKNLTASRTG